MAILAAYVIGLVFGLGIAISGMANPAKVLNFFDVAGSWDPSLAFVMGGALVVTFLGYRVLPGLKAPLLAPRFGWPAAREIDLRLVAGSALFGIGWGIAGFCPGGALPAIGTLNPAVLTFTAALVVGIFTAKFTQNLTARRANSAAA